MQQVIITEMQTTVNPKPSTLNRLLCLNVLLLCLAWYLKAFYSKRFP